MISPCPPYYSSALSCLLRSHHVLLFRLVASDCLSCSAKLVRSVLSSSLALSFSMPLASCLHLLSCYSARILSALLCHEAASIWYWEARLRLSHQGTQTSRFLSLLLTAAIVVELLVLYSGSVTIRLSSSFSFCYYAYWLASRSSRARPARGTSRGFAVPSISSFIALTAIILSVWPFVVPWGWRRRNPGLG